MIPKVVEVRPLDGHRLWLRFQDGVSGTVDLSGELWGPSHCSRSPTQSECFSIFQ